MFYSGALTKSQTDSMYVSGQGNTSCAVGRWLTNGSPSSGSHLIFTHIPQGLPYGLLVHDMVERFLLYFFHQSAHANTRGTFTTPESTKLDRNAGGYAFASAGLGNVPMALKWMLCFEEPETRTLWLAKATPRDWLAVGAAPIIASDLTTRYGRISVSLQATKQTQHQDLATYTVHINISLPSGFGNSTGTIPEGGIRLRLRAPLLYAGKLCQVEVGGKPWVAFNAAEETIDFSKEALYSTTLGSLESIVATFDTSATAIPLQAAQVDLSRRVISAPPKITTDLSPILAEVDTTTNSEIVPSCPDASTLVDSFETNGTIYAACEDLQQPDGDIVLVSSKGHTERFSKSYAPYTSNWTDDSLFYLGLGKAAVANASTDILGAKLLQDEKALSWKAVERAVPVIRSSGKGENEGGICHGIRTFVGSRSASVDVMLDDQGGDCTFDNNLVAYAINMHNKAVKAPVQASNGSATADGSVGDILPTAIFYLPMQDINASVNRYWTFFAVAIPDICPTPADGCREQNALFRFQQLECAGPNKQPPCKLIDWPMYWNSYW
jgi:hypothetical protein